MLQRKFNNLQLLQLASLLLTLVVITSTPVASLGCPPCDQSSCPNVTTCQYGTVYDACACCLECAKGPGEVCGGIWGAGGTCTNGTKCLVTVPFGSSYSTYLHTSGYCIPDKPVEPSPVPCPTPSTNIVIKPSNTSSITTTPTPTPKMKKKFRCRVPCSRSFCSDGKNKFCSAKSSGYQLVDERHPCQHTTCRACRILVEPDHCPTCPEPVTKRCLRHFFLCIAEHFKRDDSFLELHDPKAMTTKGDILCHIPKLPSVMESGSGQINTS